MSAETPNFTILGYENGDIVLQEHNVKPLEECTTLAEIKLWESLQKDRARVAYHERCKAIEAQGLGRWIELARQEEQMRPNGLPEIDQ